MDNEIPWHHRRAPAGAEPASTWLLRAAWVIPMDGPPVRDGGVVFDRASIIDVGKGDVLAGRHPGAERVDRPGDTVLPGLVNTHTHLELSEFSCGGPPASFVDWILRLVPRGHIDLQAIQESVTRSIPIGVAQCLKFGVTCVGDISRHCTVSRQLLRDGPLRVVSYGEVQAMAARRTLLESRIAVAASESVRSPFLRTALSPHAPYSVELDGYRRCLELARSHGLPLATHLAETSDEARFLADHAGPFRELWEHLQAWDDEVPRFASGPIRFAQEAGLLDYRRTLLAHVNYCDDAELEILAHGKASVAYCPRTHAYFGHPPHRWREMIARGINVTIGTDSCASSPDLNLVEELRLLRRVAPHVPAVDLWKMATVNAARALDMQNRVGVLRAGAAADFVLFRETGDDPLSAILDSNSLPHETWTSTASSS